jgi:hypothetical protein
VAIDISVFSTFMLGFQELVILLKYLVSPDYWRQADVSTIDIDFAV